MKFHSISNCLEKYSSSYLFEKQTYTPAFVSILMSSLSQLEQVLIDDVLPVLKDDSLLSSHPIVVEVSSPAEITSVFDGISYSKVGYPPVVTLDAKEVVTLERR